MESVVKYQNELIDKLAPKWINVMDEEEKVLILKQLSTTIPYMLGVFCGKNHISSEDVSVKELRGHKFWKSFEHVKLSALSEKGFRIHMKDGYNSKRSKLPIPYANPQGENL